MCNQGYENSKENKDKVLLAQDNVCVKFKNMLEEAGFEKIADNIDEYYLKDGFIVKPPTDFSMLFNDLYVNYIFFSLPDKIQENYNPTHLGYLNCLDNSQDSTWLYNVEGVGDLCFYLKTISYQSKYDDNLISITSPTTKIYKFSRSNYDTIMSLTDQILKIVDHVKGEHIEYVLPNKLYI